MNDVTELHQLRERAAFAFYVAMTEGRGVTADDDLSDYEDDDKAIVNAIMKDWDPGDTQHRIDEAVAAERERAQAKSMQAAIDLRKALVAMDAMKDGFEPMKKALEYYADEDNWVVTNSADIAGMDSSLAFDLARAALSHRFNSEDARANQPAQEAKD